MAANPNLDPNLLNQAPNQVLQGGTNSGGQQLSSVQQQSLIKQGAVPSPTSPTLQNQQPAQQPVQNQQVPVAPAGAPNTYTGNSIQTNDTITPFKNPDGTVNQDWKASSDTQLRDITNTINSSGNTDWIKALPKLTANYYGINTTTPGGLDYGASTPQQQINLQNSLNSQATSALDEQIQAATSKAQATNIGNIGGINATIGAVNREGAQSTGNQLSATAATTQFNQQFSAYKDSLTAQMTQLQQAQASGNAKLADSISQGIQATKNAMIKTQLDQATLVNTYTQAGKTYMDNVGANNALVGQTPEQLQTLADQSNGAVTVQQLQAQQAAQVRSLGTTVLQQQFDNQTKALSTVQSMVGTGTPLTLQTAQLYAQETGLSVGQLMQYNTDAQSILQNNKLDTQTKQTLLGQENQKLTQMQQGIYTSQAQNIAYLQQMYKNGSSASDIAAFKSVAGIADYNDPIQAAKLLSDQLDNSIKYKESTGQAVTPQDIQALANARATLVNAGLDPAAYIPESTGSQGGYTMVQTANGVQIQGATDGSTGGQCGHFVNQVMGAQIMPDSYKGKLAQTDPTIKVPTPGDFFVAQAPGAAAPYGHTGIVTSVDYANGTMTIQESNYSQAGKIDTRTVPITYAAGFGHPPNSNAVMNGGQTSPAGSTNGGTEPKDMNNNQIRSIMAQFGNPNPTTKDIALARTTNYIPGYSTQGKVTGLNDVIYTSPAGQNLTLKDYMGNPTSSGYSYVDMTGLTGDQQKSVQAAAKANNIAQLDQPQIDALTGISQGLATVDQVSQILAPHLAADLGPLNAVTGPTYNALNSIAAATNSDPNLKAYNDQQRLDLINIVKNIGTNGKGVSPRLVNMALDAVPNFSDNVRSLEIKVNTLKGFFKDAEKAIIENNGGTTTPPTTTGDYTNFKNTSSNVQF